MALSSAFCCKYVQLSLGLHSCLDILIRNACRLHLAYSVTKTRQIVQSSVPFSEQ